MNDVTDDAIDLYEFALRAFDEIIGGSLKHQTYVFAVCYWLAQFAVGSKTLTLLNLPPKHLKTFLGSVCLAAWILGHKPKARILIVTGNAKLIKDISRLLRKVLLSRTMVETFGQQLKRPDVDATDIETIHGGRIVIVPLHGSITGLQGDFVIFDDPHEIKDRRNAARVARVIDIFESVVRTRLNNPGSGRILVVAHRVARNDLSAALAEDDRWFRRALPLVAPKEKIYRLGTREWVRPKGDILRADEFTPETIRAFRKGPDWDFLFQQGKDGLASARILRDHFIMKDPSALVSGPAVMSVDPGQSQRLGASCSAIQIWVPLSPTKHQLVDAVEGRYNADQLFDICRQKIREHRVSVVLVEYAALGIGLVRDLRRLKQEGLSIVAIDVPQRSKKQRLLDVIGILHAGGIILRRDAEFLEDFVQQMIDFPHGDGDDHVDALTQYLSWITQRGNFPVPARPRPGIGAGTSSGGAPIGWDPEGTTSVRGAVLSQRRRW